MRSEEWWWRRTTYKAPQIFYGLENMKLAASVISTDGICAK